MLFDLDKVDLKKLQREITHVLIRQFHTENITFNAHQLQGISANIAQAIPELIHAQHVNVQSSSMESMMKSTASILIKKVLEGKSTRSLFEATPFSIKSSIADDVRNAHKAFDNFDGAFQAIGSGPDGDVRHAEQMILDRMSKLIDQLAKAFQELDREVRK